MLSAMNLNLLCTSLDNFSKVSLTEVDCEMIDGYRDICAYLQIQGFDVSWVVNRLNYIEHLCFSQPLIPELHGIDCCIEGAKTEVQHLQLLMLTMPKVIYKIYRLVPKLMYKICRLVLIIPKQNCKSCRLFAGRRWQILRKLLELGVLILLSVWLETIYCLVLNFITLMDWCI